MNNDCHYGNEYLGDHMFIYGENKGNFKWILEVTFTGWQNLKLAKYHREQPNKIRMVIPPGGKDVVVVKKIDPSKGCSNEWKFTQRWE